MNLDDMKPLRKTFAEGAKSYQKSRSSDANSYGGFILQDGELAVVGRWVCHGWLTDYNLQSSGIPCSAKLRKSKIAYMLSAVMKPFPTVSDDQLISFIDWMINRSPWAGIFVDKDATSVRKYGYVVDADNPSSFIASAMMASRFMTETYAAVEEMHKRVVIYQELLAIGCTENEAFIFAHIYTPTSAKRLYPINFARLSSGHSTFYSNNYQENYVRNFLNATPDNVAHGRLSDNSGYASGTINKIWAPQTGADSFGERVKSLIPIKQDKKEDFHIFRKAPANGFSYRDREDFASIIQQLRGLLNA